MFEFWLCHFYCSRVMPLYKWKNCISFLFPFPNFSLPQLNVKKFIINVYYHKTQINFEFWRRYFYPSRVNAMPLYKWKNCWIFCFSSIHLVWLYRMLGYLYTMLITEKTQIKFEFWWLHIYCSRVMPLYIIQMEKRWLFLSVL